MMSYKEKIIIKLQNEGFNYLPFEVLESIAHFMDMEMTPIKSECFLLAQQLNQVNQFHKTDKCILKELGSKLEAIEKELDKFKSK